MFMGTLMLFLNIAIIAAVFVALYFVVKLVVKSGIKKAYREIQDQKVSDNN